MADPVEEQGRWVELENHCATVEAERDALRLELERLRRVAEVVGASAPSGAPAVGEDLAKLKAELDETKTKNDSLLAEVVQERGRAASLACDLESKMKEMSSMSAAKLQLHFDNSKLQAQLTPVKEERVRLRAEGEEAKALLEELHMELAATRQEKSRLSREKLGRELELQDEASMSQADAEFHQRVAEEAREGQRTARQQAAEAERRLREREEDFAEEAAKAAKQLGLRDNQLRRTADSLEDTKRQLAEALGEREAALEAQAATSEEAEGLQTKASRLEEELSDLRADHEALLRKCVPGADPEQPPDGFQSLAELVRVCSAAKEQAMREKLEREQLQEVLREVEKEVRARYPALMSQREDAERFRATASRLARENEALLAQVREAQAAQHTADARARQADRSEKILEAHARDITKQLAVLVHENRKLKGFRPTVSGAAALEALDADRAAFRSVEDLTEQNENLRRALMRLKGESETAAQKELQVLRQEKEQQDKELETHLEEKALQMKALAETAVLLTKERDEARKSLHEAQQRAPAGAALADVRAPAAPPAPEEPPSEKFKSMQAELNKRIEDLRLQLGKAQDAELKVKQDLATSCGKLNHESGRCKNLDAALEQKDREIDERKAELNQLQRRSKALEDGKKRHDGTVHELDAQLAQGRHERSQLEKQLHQQRSKAAELERSAAALVAEKAAHVQGMVDLQAQAAREADLYKELKRNLEASFEGKALVLKEKLTVAEKRHEDLQQHIEAVSAARAASLREAEGATATANGLQAANAKLEERLAQSKEEAKVLKEKAAALGSSFGKSADVARLEQKLKFAEEREQEYHKNVETWKLLSTSQEQELKKKQDELTSVREGAEKVTQLHSALEAEASQLRQKGQTAEARIQELTRDTAQLQGSLDGRSADAERAGLQAQEEVLKSKEECQQAKLEAEDARIKAEEWARKHDRVVQDHGLTITELDTVKMRHETLDKEAKELRSRLGDLAGEADRARTERADEVETLSKRLDFETKRCEVLTLETKKYQEHLLAIAAKGSSGGVSDPPELLSLDMDLARARETEERKRQELEDERARLERERRALRGEVSELQRRLDGEQREVLRLQAEVKNEQRAITKLGQLGLLEDENRSLAVKARAAEDQLDNLRQVQARAQAEAMPMKQELETLRKKGEEWERERQKLEARADEWKRSFNVLAAMAAAAPARAASPAPAAAPVQGRGAPPPTAASQAKAAARPAAAAAEAASLAAAKAAATQPAANEGGAMKRKEAPAAAAATVAGTASPGEAAAVPAEPPAKAARTAEVVASLPAKAAPMPAKAAPMSAKAAPIPAKAAPVRAKAKPAKAAPPTLAAAADLPVGAGSSAGASAAGAGPARSWIRRSKWGKKKEGHEGRGA